VESIEYRYELIVRESMLDVMGHLNHAAYLTLFEEARWDLCANQGMTIEFMQERGIGLVVIEAQIRYRKEVRARERLIIKTRFSDVERKIWKASQTMEKSSGELCSTIQIKGTVFDLKTRKFISADAEWRSVFLGHKIR